MPIQHIKQLIKFELFALHFAPNTVDMFWTTIDLSADMILIEALLQLLDKFFDIDFAV